MQLCVVGGAKRRMCTVKEDSKELMWDAKQGRNNNTLPVLTPTMEEDDPRGAGSP